MFRNNWQHQKNKVINARTAYMNYPHRDEKNKQLLHKWSSAIDNANACANADRGFMSNEIQEFNNQVRQLNESPLINMLGASLNLMGRYS